MVIVITIINNIIFHCHDHDHDHDHHYYYKIELYKKVKRSCSKLKTKTMRLIKDIKGAAHSTCMLKASRKTFPMQMSFIFMRRGSKSSSGFAIRYFLKKRLWVTRQWPIERSFKSSAPLSDIWLTLRKIII